MRLCRPKISNKGILLLIPAVLIFNLISIQQIHAAGSESLIGSWRGTVWVDDKPIGVDMKIDSLKGNQKANKFHYTEPRACKVNPEYISERDHKYWFVMKTGTGNICIRKLEGGYLVIQLDGKDTLTYTVTSKDKTYTETGKLERE